MISRSMIAAGVGIVALAAMQMPTPARAQSAREAEIIGFHDLCQKGDRRACVRFGILIGENREHHAEWRRRYSHWFWWER